MKRKPLDGLKVADFSWVGVGPVTVKYLADHGATVIHVESQTRVETLRRASPFKDNQPGLNRSGFFANFNTNKYGMSLNLNLSQAKVVVDRLIRWCDVLAESFTPGTTRRWGLDYESAHKLNARIVYFSTCQFGQTGPYRRQPGFGIQLASLSGFTEITGWPDLPPAGPYGAYTDFINPRLGAAAILAALDYRDRTGKGQYLDLSQFEGSCQFLSPAILDYTVNHRNAQRMGNRSPCAAPHGCYPCSGSERWCVIAVRTEAQWLALRKAMGDPEWAADKRFAKLADRKAHEDALDQLIGEWTATLTPDEVMTRLQAAGVPAGSVRTAEELFTDPQLQHRKHFKELAHTEIGPHHYDVLSFRSSAFDNTPVMPAPCLGEHNEFAYKELLGFSDEEVAEFVVKGLLD